MGGVNRVEDSGGEGGCKWESIVSVRLILSGHPSVGKSSIINGLMGI